MRRSVLRPYMSVGDSVGSGEATQIEAGLDRPRNDLKSS